MAETVTLDQVEQLAAKLLPQERLRLIARIAQDLAVAPPVGRAGRLWSEIRGIVPYPMCGEDAQAWVSRSRRESDEHREKQWRREL